MTTARARNSDPITSHEAAASVLTSPIRARVLEILTVAGPAGLSHEEIAREYRRREIALGWRLPSPSGIRSRVAELHSDGEVEIVPDVFRKSPTGRRAHVWRVTSV